MSFNITSLTIYSNNGYIICGDTSRLPRSTSSNTIDKDGILSVCDDGAEKDIMYKINGVRFGIILKENNYLSDNHNLGKNAYLFLVKKKDDILKNNFEKNLQYIPSRGVLQPIPNNIKINISLGDFSVKVWSQKNQNVFDNISEILRNFIEILNKKINLDISSDEKSI